MTFHLAIGSLFSLSFSTGPPPSQVHETTREKLGSHTQSFHSHSLALISPLTPISLLVCLSTGKGSPPPYRSLVYSLPRGKGSPSPTRSLGSLLPIECPSPSILAHQDYCSGRLNSYTITLASWPLARVTYQ